MRAQKTILVTGGAGYIGSHVAHLLARKGRHVVVLDALLQGQAFPHPWATFIYGDFSDRDLLRRIFTQYDVEGVVHLAALIEVGVSVAQPARFYESNVVKTLRLLDCMLEYGIRKLVFSSSCAIYGQPIKVPIDELHPIVPESPYARSKAAVEYIIEDYARAYGLTYASMRYFNAAGADLPHDLGEQHEHESHLIPLVLRALIKGEPITIFGDDYQTPDGSCLRDYVHVLDLAQAHLLAYDFICQHGRSEVFNLGSGKASSVKEVILLASEMLGLQASVMVQPRRPGDSPCLVADNGKAQRILGWQLQHSDLETIIKSAQAWELRVLQRSGGKTLTL